ncbi:MAG: PQQ-like beta-propeller repeat protein [Lentisphaeraceae bacterium]|nr:PQQ-like beta-propeller repeat protein [Lentisphaeraceae bacterium]
MLIVKQYISFLIGSVLLINGLLAENKSVKVDGSDNQWPMSGGPDGSYRVKTSAKVPTKWSVRNNVNIKWKTPLPEGGQSGIAVWGDKLFLTINPPLDTAPYTQSKSQFETAKKKYRDDFAAALKKLDEDSDPMFKEVTVKRAEAQESWNDFLKSNKAYQKTPANKNNRVKADFLKKTDIGKTLHKFSQQYVNYVHDKFPEVASVYKRMKASEKAMKTRGNNADIILYCLDSNSGEVLWQKPVKGLMSSGYNYGFSDSTTPCPATDGVNVWAINSSGGMACFTMNGDVLWERTWMPSGGRPFNKQFDSILYKGLILNVEPPVKEDSSRVHDWNYLHAFDKKTGQRVWVTKEALTHYNTPLIGETSEGRPAVLIGRGGPHGVPERPIGLSLISLDSKNSGSSLWNWEPKDENAISGWGALSTQHWDKDKASWFYAGNDHLTVNTKTGKLIAQQKLNVVNQYSYDETAKKYILKENLELIKQQNQRHCNISAGDYVFYMVRFEPYIARHNVKTGKNEHVEVPREIDSSGNFVWKKEQKNDGLNSQGQMHGADGRTRGGGFQKCFLGSPTMVNNYIFFTNAIGMVYVMDANAEKFDESAIISVNDLGKAGETWTVNTLTYANGKIYHRTMKEVICIE